MVKQPACIEIRTDVIPQLVLVEHFLIGEAVFSPNIHALLQLFHMGRGQAGEDILFFQIAFDVIGFDPFANDLSAFLNHAGNKCCGVFPIAFVNGLQAGIQPVNDLAAIAP